MLQGRRSRGIEVERDSYGGLFWSSSAVPVDFYHPSFDPSRMTPADPVPTLPADPHALRVTVDRIGVRRRHGFLIQDPNLSIPLPPATNPHNEDLFHSSSDGLGVTPSEHEKDLGRQRSGKGSSQLPLELGSDSKSGGSDGVGILFCKRFLKINCIIFESLFSMPSLLFVFLVLLSVLGKIISVYKCFTNRMSLMPNLADFVCYHSGVHCLPRGINTGQILQSPRRQRLGGVLD